MRKTLALLALATLASGCSDEVNGQLTGAGDWLAEPPLAPVFEPPDDVVDDVCSQAVDTDVTLHMSADDSNSQAQPALLRRALRAGDWTGGGLRAYEFLNHYDFDYEPAPAGQVSLVPQVRQDEDGLTMLIGVVAPDVAPADRPDVNLTFSVDTSCSMGGQAISRAKDAILALSGELREGDLVSMSTWATGNRDVLIGHAIAGPDDALLAATTDALETGGSTDLEGGLQSAYALADANFDEERLNRVVFFSDGGANTGVTSQDLIAQHAEDGEGEGIYLVAVGSMSGSFYQDALMNEVSDLGKGSYVFLDRDGEAERLFTGDNMLATLGVAARDVRLAVTLPPGFVLDTFHGEEVSEDPEEVEPQHLAPNDQMLYHYTLADCAMGEDDPLFAFEVTWTDPVTRQDQTVTVERRLSELLDAPRRQLEKADAIIAFVDAMSSMDPEELAGAQEQLDAALAAFPDDADLREVRDLMDLAD